MKLLAEAAEPTYHVLLMLQPLLLHRPLTMPESMTHVCCPYACWCTWCYANIDINLATTGGYG
jgi:hypothetical protein